MIDQYWRGVDVIPPLPPADDLLLLDFEQYVWCTHCVNTCMWEETMLSSAIESSDWMDCAV